MPTAAASDNHPLDRPSLLILIDARFPSRLSRHTRFAGGGVRRRKQGIVALARKLLIALWRYLEDGVMPEGARLKTAVAA